VNIKIEEIQEGYVLLKDVMGLTAAPIMPKNTVLTRKHIEILNAFFIKEIEISNVMTKTTESESKDTTKQNGKEIQSVIPPIIKSQFTDLYTKAVGESKKEFKKWEAGFQVDIAKLRGIILPLIQYMDENPTHLKNLHKHSKKEDYLYHHMVGASLLSYGIAKKLGEDNAFRMQAAFGGLLADAGMAKIDQNILKKAGPLNELEFKEIKQHSTYSYKMIKDLSLLKPEVKLAVFQHHERLDGSGYPVGEKRERIHILSQIISVADVYHAFTVEHVYKKAVPSFNALEWIRYEGFGKFNHIVVEALQSIIGNLSIGTRVRLSDGSEGEVMFTKPDHLMRPLVKIETTGKLIDLVKERSLFIEETHN
jgi:HD-GYP domain-containing protein (c-di-GMP phosphodiesterase class II)